MSNQVTVLALKTFDALGIISVGDIVDLVKEPNNPHDKNAIMVIRDGAQVGYLANDSGKTVLEGTLSATQAQSIFETEVRARIISIANSPKTLAYMEMFKAEIMNEEALAPESEDSVIKFTLTGGFTTNPGKKDLIKEVKASGEAHIKIFEQDGNVLGSFDGELVGKVNTTDESFPILSNYLNGRSEVIATAKDIDMTNIVCELILDKEYVVKEVDIQKEIDRIVSLGIDTEEEVNTKIQYMRDNHVTELCIGYVLSSYILYPEDVRGRVPEKPDVLFVDSEENLVSKSIYYMIAGKYLTFEGDRGVGKNVLTETLCWLFSRPLYEFSSNSQHSNNSLLGGQTFSPPKKEEKEEVTSVLGRIFAKFLGVKEPKSDEIGAIENILDKLSQNHNKELIFEMSSILEAFVNGGMIVLDEFNTSLAHVTPIFNALLDDRKRMEVTGLGLIVGHKNFCAISTQNRDYEGTFDANEATIDRFEPILFPPSNSLLGVLRSKVPQLDYETLTLANNLYIGILDAVKATQLDSKSVTVRGFISACQVIALGLDKKTAFMTSIAGRAANESDKQVIKNIIDLLIR